MKSRLSSTIWMLVFLNGIALAGTIWFAFTVELATRLLPARALKFWFTVAVAFSCTEPRRVP